MTLEKIITKLQGPIIQTFWEFDPRTIQDASQIIDLRRVHKDFREDSFWTADLAVYTLGDNTVFLYLAKIEDNVVFTFDNIESKTDQLIRERNIFLSQQEQARVIQSPKSLQIDLSKLNLARYNYEFYYFDVNTTDYNETLNPHQRLFAERVYGEGKKFETNMQFLSENGVKNTRIYVLNPDYVRQMCGKNGSITRIGELDEFSRSNFRAVGRNIGDEKKFLCGQIDQTGIGKKLKNKQLQLPKAIQIILAHPDTTREYIDDAQADALREIVALYKKHNFDGIISIRDSLLQSFWQLDPDSIQHAHEITTSRRSNIDIRNEWFWTADCAIYCIEGNDFVLYLARRNNNLILKDDAIEEAAKQLISDSSRDFVVPRSDSNHSTGAQDTLKIPYREMELVESNHEFSYMRLPIKDDKSLGGLLLEIARRVLGENQDFHENREFMLGNDIDAIDFFVLNPAYLKKKINPLISLTRVCRLGMIKEDSVFKAIGRGVGSPYIHLRGKLRYPGRSSGEIDSALIRDALSLISKNPLKTAEYLNERIYGPFETLIEN